LVTILVRFTIARMVVQCLALVVLSARLRAVLLLGLS